LRTPQAEPVAPVPIEDTRYVTPSDGEPGEAPQQADLDHSARPAGVRHPLPDGTTVAPEPEGRETGVARDNEGSLAGATVPAPGPATPLVPEVAPMLLTAPRGGVGDDLKRLNGIGPKLEQLLHELGVWHFDQIAGWGPGEIAWVNSRLGGFRGRAERDDWVGQARKLTGL
jgi:NADH-quinone oxidoreductase subunit E